LGSWYEQSSGKQCSAVIGYKYANMELVIDALQRAQTLDAQALRDAIAATDIDTVIGHIKYNEQNWCEPMLLGGQWTKVDGKWIQNIIVNKNNTSVPLSSTPMKAIPNSK
jgi:branched-chain amino acid transport system substrate-binding protein